MPLEITSVSKSFGQFAALRDVSLLAEDSEFVALLGPSGSGKTTLLRIIAGLETPDAGAVHFRGENLLEKRVRERRIGFVFQHYALFRHMTAAQNVAFGMRARPMRDRLPERRLRARVEELLALVQLDGLGARYPSQLSGGQRQRVALARALAIEPRILLLDEPFGALDAKVRRDLRRWLRDLHERTGLTTLFVTHDQEEALDLADRVVLLQGGAIEQLGTPEELYHEPASPFVFDFLGDTVKFDCIVTNGAAIIAGVAVPIVGASLANGPAIAYARPDQLDVAGADGAGVGAQVRKLILAGPDAQLDCVLDGGGAMDVPLPREDAAKFAPRQRVRIMPRSVRVWPRGA